MDDKIIVTNRTALTAKYGTTGLAKIKAAITTLIAADKKRGFNTRLIYLDDATAMRRLRGRAVMSAQSAVQNKQAIDALYRARKPEYLMILGAPDVVPHQDMTNSLSADQDDPDRHAYGDLPYACDAPYSRDIAAFRGPTRVVGRLPDLTGAREPSYLLALLGTAASYKTRSVSDYGRYFGLSTYSWRKSTELSLFDMFGNSTAMLLSPSEGPDFPASRLAPLSHFINCHGSESDPALYGERGRKMPFSLNSGALVGKIREGTVAAVECCYGAQMYDSVTLALPLPICQQYLSQGAYGYFGSSTIAYGPAEGNGAADLITKYFVLALLEGASLGRAALLARQRFVQQTAELDPVDLKTLAQFSLLGDPSIHPAKVASPTGLPKGVEPSELKRQQRNERRAKMKIVGDMLRDTKPTASRKTHVARKSPTVQKALSNIAKEAGINSKTVFTAFRVNTPVGARAGAKAAGVASRYYVAVYMPPAKSGKNPDRRVAAVAKEVGGRIIGYRIYGEK
jgi:hypothetical protein